MAPEKRTFHQLPKKIALAAKIHQNPSIVDYYECKTKEDLFELSAKYPFETTIIANNANESKTTEGWYMVGLSVPSAEDKYKRPVLAYFYLTETDKRFYSEDIKKEVARRAKLYNETKQGWKNLLRP